jgi:hypothetical protein
MASWSFPGFNYGAIFNGARFCDGPAVPPIGLTPRALRSAHTCTSLAEQGESVLGNVELSSGVLGVMSGSERGMDATVVGATGYLRIASLIVRGTVLIAAGGDITIGSISTDSSSSAITFLSATGRVTVAGADSRVHIALAARKGFELPPGTAAGAASFPVPIRLHLLSLGAPDSS